MEKTILQINKENVGKRVDVYLASTLGLTRSHIRKLCDEGNLIVNSKISKSNKILKENDVVEFVQPQIKKLDIEPEDIPIDIVYQDDDIAIINKPQGMTVHAGSGTNGSTLVNALLFHLDKLSGINGVIRPGIVHRIDKNTSGLLVVAKNDKAHLSLAKQIEEKSCKRTYYALLEGCVKSEKGKIATFIGRSTKDRTKMAVTTSGRDAVTEYKVIERFNGYTLCEFSLQTGRTHQIRVHAKHIGHPVVGDKEYGFKNQRFNLNGQLLHAMKLSFIHPTTAKKVEFECPLPDYFLKVLKKLKNENKSHFA